MSVYRDAHRLGLDDLNHVEIPEHLRYHEPRVDNTYRGVEPRYLNPRVKKEPPKPELLIPKEKIPQNPHYRRVDSRILEPRKASPAPPPIPRFDPKTLELHAAIAGKAWGGAQPRYLDIKKPPEGAPTPRDQVEARREANKRISSWRDVCTTPAAVTFDEIRQRNRRLLSGHGQRNHVDVAPKPGSHSPVRQYIKRGEPIPHHTTGANYVSPSPRRDAVERHWTPGGGAGGGRWTRQNAPAAASIVREAKYIRAWREHAAEAKVGRKHVPRVASLSPAQVFRRWESDSLHISTPPVDAVPLSSRSANNTPRRARSVTAATDSPQRLARRGDGADEVVVGPVMVAVPAGTAIKFHTTPVN